MEILNQFGINPLLLAAQVVNFAILLFILKRFLYKPILKVLEERKNKIETSLKNAEEIENRLLRTNDEVEKILAKALKQAEEIIDESKAAGIETVEEYKKTGEEILEKAYKQALEVKKAEKVKLEEEIKAHLGNIVALSLEKVTGITMDKHKREIIEKEVKNIS